MRARRRRTLPREAPESADGSAPSEQDAISWGRGDVLSGDNVQVRNRVHSLMLIVLLALVSSGVAREPAEGRAWASKTKDAQTEWLEVEYATARPLVAVRLFENHSPGAVRRIVAIDEDGTEHEVWSGRDPTPPGLLAGTSLIPFRTVVTCRRLQIHLASPEVAGWNEIDAVGAHDLEGNLHWAIGARASSTFAAGEPALEQARRPLPTVALADLPNAWRTPADGLLELLLERLRVKERDLDLCHKLATQILAVQRAAREVASFDRDSFTGLWSTRFGLLKLRHDEDRVTGTYLSSGVARVEGVVAGDRLTFRYREQETAGEGWFQLAEDGHHFEGRWREDGATAWSAWKGERVLRSPHAGKTWLVILEAPWQTNLSEPEYSFGGMLRALFAPSEDVLVRQRFFHDREDFQRWCAELCFVTEPIVLMIATHATKEGLSAGDMWISPREVAEALSAIDTLRLVHFSACEAMAGTMPEMVLQQRPPNDSLTGISGYDISVDWMASAVTEFLYLDLILNRKLSPPEAAEELLASLDFADAESHDGSPVPAVHFRFLPHDQPNPATE